MRQDALDEFLRGKSDIAVGLFLHFADEFRKAAKVTIHPAKTMIGVATSRKRVAYVTQFGKNFITVVFPFGRPYENNLCFHKIAKVPGDTQHNHYFRMYAREDVNAEVIGFMKLAAELGG